VALLTSRGRTEWAAGREKLLAASAANQETMEVVEQVRPLYLYAR
jgi:hypothetical protein